MSAPRGDRSQTIASWLALLCGGLGLHRFYLRGLHDLWGWLLWLPTLAGAYGVQRMRLHGQDDQLAWVLIPLLGLALAGTMLQAIVFALMPDERWNARYNRGKTGASLPWLNVLAAIVALSVGAAFLIASIAFVAQRYFEFDAMRAAPSGRVVPQGKSERLAP